MQKPSAASFIPVLIIVSIIAGGLYFLFKPQNDSIRQTPLSVLTQADQPEISNRTAPLQEPEENSASENDSDTGLYRKAPMDAIIADPCLDTIKELDTFFVYLDSQDYIKDYQFPAGSKDFVASVVNKALSHPPTPKDTKGVINQVKTGAYLYQIIGGQNLLILAKILENEPDRLENIFASFYNWSQLTGQCPNRTYAIRPQLDQLYRYALFFSDSTDGQHYLSRRDTTTSLLTRFYAVQILKEAQTSHIDQYNTDLMPHITSLITDIESTDLLAEKETYLQTLYTLRGK